MGGNQKNIQRQIAKKKLPYNHYWIEKLTLLIPRDRRSSIEARKFSVFYFVYRPVYSIFYWPKTSVNS